MKHFIATILLMLSLSVQAAEVCLVVGASNHTYSVINDVVNTGTEHKLNNLASSSCTWFNVSTNGNTVRELVEAYEGFKASHPTVHIPVVYFGLSGHPILSGDGLRVVDAAFEMWEVWKSVPVDTLFITTYYPDPYEATMISDPDSMDVPIRRYNELLHIWGEWYGNWESVGYGGSFDEVDTYYTKWWERAEIWAAVDFPSYPTIDGLHAVPELRDDLAERIADVVEYWF